MKVVAFRHTCDGTVDDVIAIFYDIYDFRFRLSLYQKRRNVTGWGGGGGAQRVCLI